MFFKNTFMKQCFIGWLGLVLITAIGNAQTPAELPNTVGLETCFPDTAGYAVVTVGPVGRDFTDLQAAINAANPGSILVLDAGEVFAGSFTLPNKTGDGWIIITSSHLHLLPKQETRLSPEALTGDNQYPTQKEAMPRIVTTNLSGLPCFKTQASAHHYRLVGLDISADPSVINSYGLVFLGDGSPAQNTMDQVPHNLIIDRCYIHGHNQATVMKAGVLLNSANSAVVDSYISEFHSIGYDTYAIGGTNGPGPFKILNNYLEAAGENILFGGAAPAIPGLVPSDIEIRNNFFFKPYSWRVGHPTYAGKHWTIKNLFELKTGTRVLLDGNIMENCWADLPIGQSGYAILLTVRTENGGAPQANVSDVTITNNIIRHVGAGISLSGHDSGGSGLQSKRIRIANNLFEDINGPAYGDGNIYGPNDGTFLKIGDPDDVSIDHNTVLQTGPITWSTGITQNIAITNNIFLCYPSAGGYQGIHGPGHAHGGNGPLAAFFPGITDANQLFHQNVLIGGPDFRYSNYNTLSQNHFPATPADVQFVDYTNGAADYHLFALLAASPYAAAATDGLNIGFDLLQLDSALVARASCAPTVAVHMPLVAREIQVWPNPFTDRFTLSSSMELNHADLVLYNVLGQEVLRKKIESGQQLEMQTGTLAPGVYVAVLWEKGKMVACWKLLKRENYNGS